MADELRDKVADVIACYFAPHYASNPSAAADRAIEMVVEACLDCIPLLLEDGSPEHNAVARDRDMLYGRIRALAKETE